MALIDSKWSKARTRTHTHTHTPCFDSHASLMCVHINSYLPVAASSLPPPDPCALVLTRVLWFWPLCALVLTPVCTGSDTCALVLTCVLWFWPVCSGSDPCVLWFWPVCSGSDLCALVLTRVLWFWPVCSGSDPRVHFFWPVCSGSDPCALVLTPVLWTSFCLTDVNRRQWEEEVHFCLLKGL